MPHSSLITMHFIRKEQPNTSRRNVDLKPARLFTVLRLGINSHWCSAVMGQCAYPVKKKTHLEHTSMVLTCVNVSLPITVSLCPHQHFFKCHVFSIKRSRTGIKAHNHNQVFDRSG